MALFQFSDLHTGHPFPYNVRMHMSSPTGFADKLLLPLYAVRFVFHHWNPVPRRNRIPFESG